HRLVQCSRFFLARDQKHLSLIEAGESGKRLSSQITDEVKLVEHPVGIPTVRQALDEDANYKFSEKYPDGKQFFQASKRQVPSFSVNSHPSVQNWSTLRLIYQKARANSRSKTAREKKFFPSRSGILKAMHSMVAEVL